MVEIVAVPEKAGRIPALVDDVQSVINAGEDAAGRFVVDTEDAVKTVRKIHEAARYLGVSARIRAREVHGDETGIVFTLGERVTRKRRPKTDEDSAAEADGE